MTRVFQYRVLRRVCQLSVLHWVLGQEQPSGTASDLIKDTNMEVKIASWSSSKAIITDRNINLLELQSNQTPKDNHKTLSRSTRLKEWALAVYVLPAVHSMSHKTHQKLFKFNCIGINIQESFKSTPPPRA